jgi:hypothetical protein
VHELKIGDYVFQIEKHPEIPGGIWKWKAKVVAIESNYIETEYARDRSVEWLRAITNRLAPNHRTYNTGWCKNYYDPKGCINLEPYTE